MLSPESINNKHQPFDLLIIGQGIQPLLILNQALDKGLNSILVSCNDCAENLNENPIQSMDFDYSPNIFKILKHKYLIKSIRKSFLHLFISTKTEYYGQFNWIRKFLILFNELIFNEIIDFGQFKFSKFPHYSANAFKFSIGRMSVSLLKKAVQLGAQVHSYSQIKSIQKLENQLYKVEFEDTVQNKTYSVLSKNILRFDLDNPSIDLDSSKIANKTDSIFYFSYPASKLKIERNRFLKTSHQYLKIITWFDEVYFEYYNLMKPNISLEELTALIKHYFTDIEIDISYIQNSGTFNLFSKKQNKNRTQAIYFNAEKQIYLKYKSIYQWFNYSNKICNQLVRKLENGKSGNSVIGKLVFPGSDLQVSDNPLRIMELADEKYDLAKQILKSPVYFKKLFYRYGSDIEQITEKAYEYWNQAKDSQYAWLKAEIEFCIENEFCNCASDFINLRTELWMELNQTNKMEIEQIFNEL